MHEVDLEDVELLIEGALDARISNGYLRPWRLPLADADLHDPMLRFVAGMASGVRLRFRTDSPVVVLSVSHALPVGLELPAPPRYDVVIGGEVVQRIDAPGESAEVTIGDLPADEVVEVWLPHVAGVRIRSLRVEEGSRVVQARDDRPRWVTYGSSISHCVEAEGPAGAWPAVAARALDWHLTSMGFAGQAQLDPHSARALAALRADRITLKVGINIHNGASARERLFAPLVHGFLATVRDAHPTTPITVISPVLSPDREDSGRTIRAMPGQPEEIIDNDLTLIRMRRLLEQVVGVWRDRGDEHIDYLDGRELFGCGDDDLAHLPDGLHPDAEGYRRMGERFAALVKAGSLVS